jgi:hypothetical protein
MRGRGFFLVGYLQSHSTWVVMRRVGRECEGEEQSKRGREESEGVNTIKGRERTQQKGLEKKETARGRTTKMEKGRQKGTLGERKA